MDPWFRPGVFCWAKGGVGGVGGALFQSRGVKLGYFGVRNHNVMDEVLWLAPSVLGNRATHATYATFPNQGVGLLGQPSI